MSIPGGWRPRLRAGRVLLVVAVVAGVLALDAGAVVAIEVPRTLSEIRPLETADATTVEVAFPIDYLGVIWDTDEDHHHPDELAGTHGQVRFRRDGAWGAWIDFVPEGIEVEGQWASGLVWADDAEAYEIRGIPDDAIAPRAMALNTSDGPLEQRGEVPRTGALTNCKSRAEWGADESKRTWPAEFHPAQTLTVHHTAGPNNLSDPAGYVRAVYNFHAVGQGWGDIGYHFLIDESGRIYEGRWSGSTSQRCGSGGTGFDFAHNGQGRLVTAGHTLGHNDGNVGIALLGNFEEAQPKGAAVTALERALAELANRHGFNPRGTVNYRNPVNGNQRTVNTISGHRDWDATACPGSNLYSKLPQIRNNVDDLVDDLPPPSSGNGEVGDKVWDDIDGDGRQDSGEPGVAGVTVRLKRGDAVVATTQTNGNGVYRFTDLPPARYRVEFVAPAGREFTLLNAGGNDAVDSDANKAYGRTAPFDLGAGETNLTLDAGLLGGGGKVGDRVWEDTNRDGLQSAGEPGVGGVRVKLKDGAEVAATTTTAADGSYRFSGVPPGRYRVEFVKPEGRKFTAINVGSDDTVDSDPNNSKGRTAPFVLGAGESNLTLDAGLLPDGGAPPSANVVGDRAWEDTNRDGLQSPGEPGVAGITVRLKVGSTVVATTQTAADGAYAFTDVPAGTYRLEFVAPDGRHFTWQNNGTDDTIDSDTNDAFGRTPPFDLAEGESNLTLDAGLRPAGGDSGGGSDAEVGDLVWEDVDGDGLQDADEPGVGGVTVRLREGNLVIATTETTTDGAFLFDGVDAGSYRVEFSPPSGWLFTQRDAGTDDSIDSDPTLNAGRTGTFELATDESNLTLDAGLISG